MTDDAERKLGWSGELRVLLDRHPRETWAAARSAEAAFWLDIHDHFRRDCVALEGFAADYHAGRRTAAEISAMAAPRLFALIGNLHGHHQIEDFHYFPVFKRFDPRLAAGFDALEADHVRLKRDIDASRAALFELQSALEANAGRDHVRLAASRYATTTGSLCRAICRHLSDEEDLVVPLLIERGDH